jgi:hypothetical protein
MHCKNLIFLLGNVTHNLLLCRACATIKTNHFIRLQGICLTITPVVTFVMLIIDMVYRYGWIPEGVPLASIRHSWNRFVCNTVAEVGQLTCYYFCDVITLLASGMSQIVMQLLKWDIEMDVISEPSLSIHEATCHVPAARGHWSML